MMVSNSKDICEELKENSHIGPLADEVGEENCARIPKHYLRSIEPKSNLRTKPRKFIKPKIDSKLQTQINQFYKVLTKGDDLSKFFKKSSIIEIEGEPIFPIKDTLVYLRHKFNKQIIRKDEIIQKGKMSVLIKGSQGFEHLIQFGTINDQFFIQRLYMNDTI